MRILTATCLLATLIFPAGPTFAFTPQPGSETPSEAPPLAPGAGPTATGEVPSPGGGPVGAPGGEAASDVEPGALARDPQESLPTVLRTEEAMPPVVRDTWRAIVEASRSGDVEALRPLLEKGEPPTSVAFSGVDDPISYLRSLSGDIEGREILAILLEVMEAGFVHIGEGTGEEMYVWPYFAQYPLETLTPPQIVELFTLLTAADYQEMRSYGAYIFFRAGIRPDGSWAFFLAGD